MKSMDMRSPTYVFIGIILVFNSYTRKIYFGAGRQDGNALV